MNGRYFAYIAGLLFLFTPWSVARSATVTATASGAPVACASSVAETPSDLQTAFAREIDSPGILHFVTSLASAAPKQQKRAFDMAVTAASSVSESKVQAAVSDGCPDIDALYGSARASYLTVNVWQLGGFSNAQRFRAFLGVLATAVAASSENESLSAEDRTAALLPFQDLLAQVSAAPSATMPGACARPDVPARLVNAVEPSYPATARLAGTTGTVLVVIQLSSMGDVRSARLVRDTLGRGGGWQDLVHATILAAAASTYAPQVKGCTPVLGSYIYRSDFTSG